MRVFVLVVAAVVLVLGLVFTFRVRPSTTTRPRPLSLRRCRDDVRASSNAPKTDHRQSGNLGVMDSQTRWPTSVRDIWRLALAVIGVTIIQELRKPPDERTWHGKVADVVPYDFRIPTIDRMKSTYWNPEGPVLSSKVFGVGWAPNFGAGETVWEGNRWPASF